MAENKDENKDEKKVSLIPTQNNALWDVMNIQEEKVGKDQVPHWLEKFEYRWIKKRSPDIENNQ